tara:strand:- start:6816 stop:7214 length:399 start_codon:yes stop_codon:yes gene_type:complete
MSEERDKPRDKSGDIDLLVDHEELSERDKKIADDILKTINEQQSHKLPLKHTISQIKENYKLEEVPMMSVEDSLWYEFTKDEKLGANIQGYTTIEKDGKKIRIPHVHFSADLDYLNNMMSRIITRINNIRHK